MESSLFLILQTLAGIGMNELLTVNASKPGLGDTSPSNLKQERLFNPTFKKCILNLETFCTSCGQKYSANSSGSLVALQVCHKVLIFRGIQHLSCRGLCFNALTGGAGEHVNSSGIKWHVCHSLGL